jgi:hypothetical protein
LVTDAASSAEAAAFMEEHCRSARVMPFLPGVPCSVHAMVFPDGEYAFRPCEMIVFRTPGSPMFRYAGVTSWWEPDDADRAEMHHAALSVARLLRDRVGYRGSLGIDGVMTAAGFRPTELNPRHSVGLNIQGQGPERPLPLASIHRLLVAGEDVDYRAAEFHRIVLDNAAAHPQMRPLTPVSTRFEETAAQPIRLDGGEVHAAPDDAAHGTLSVGPAAMGGVVMLRIEPEHAVVGPSAAPMVTSAFRLADDLWGTGVGPLIPADEVR